MDILSTVLWHMKKETELAYLAHEALAIDRLCPQTWCVLGNCIQSLQKEHESALKFFQAGPRPRADRGGAGGHRWTQGWSPLAEA